MAEYREFKTGATRTPDDHKLDFDGFLSPLVLHRFARYMHKNRRRRDGTLRESDNWQKGIPVPCYMKSMFRHFFAVWKNYRRGKVSEPELCALLFNVQGMLHETLNVKVKPRSRARPTTLTARERNALARKSLALLSARARNRASTSKTLPRSRD